MSYGEVAKRAKDSCVMMKVKTGLSNTLYLTKHD